MSCSGDVLSTPNAEGLESQQMGMNNRKQLVFCGRESERETERERWCGTLYVCMLGAVYQQVRVCV